MSKPCLPLRVSILSIVLAILSSSAIATDWPQWGGPRRDFTASAVPAVRAIGPTGPRKLWTADLGPGYSAIVVEGDRLIATFRSGQQDVIACLDRQTGETTWEYRHTSPVSRSDPAVETSFGVGPNSTPVIAAGRVYALGFGGTIHAVNLADGTLAWSHDLSAEYEVPTPYFGHSASPIVFEDTVIFVAGGALAFDLASGALRWSNRSFGASYASPILISRTDGPLLVAAGAGEIVGLDPRDGTLHWRHEHANQHRTILNSPMFGDDDRLFVSAYFLGSIGLALSKDGRSIEEEWETPQFQLSHANGIRIGNTVYGFHREVLSALDVSTGQIVWRHRGLRNSTMIRIDEWRLLLLDAIGKLTLVSVGPEGPTIEGETQVLEGRSWTVPTLIGNVLYIRDQEKAVALDLSRSAAPPAGPGAAAAAAPEIRTDDRFGAARVRLGSAVHHGDPSELVAARAGLEAWFEQPSVAHLAHYYWAFAAWSEATTAEAAAALGLIDAAVDHLEAAIRLQRDFADAHALLARIYRMYYQLAPRRAAVIGPLSTEHLELAKLFAPGNPRVVMIDGLQLADRPKEYGGDLDAGLRRMEEALAIFEDPPITDSGVDPAWNHGLSWTWYGQALLRGSDEQRRQAPRAFERALEIQPDLATAERSPAASGTADASR